MGILCGHCKERHESIDAVRACSREHTAVKAQLTVASRPAGAPASEKQQAFLRRLIADRPAWADVMNYHPDVVARFTRAEASAVIDQALTTEPEKAATQPDVTVTGAVADGTYTVVNGDGTYRTLRLRDAAWAKDLPPGSQVVEFLSGSDNESDFTGFAFVVQGRLRVWKRFKEDTRIVDAVRFLLAADDDAVREAGFAYALRSGRCYRCGHTLTVPASIHRGLGPVCAGREG